MKALIWQVCRKLRMLYNEGLPIIMLSANDDEASILKGLQVGLSFSSAHLKTLVSSTKWPGASLHAGKTEFTLSAGRRKRLRQEAI